MRLDGAAEVAHAAGGAAATTNNRMELAAVIAAVRHFAPPAALAIHTDSTYVVKGVTQWLAGWKARGWRNAQRQPVANQDLWGELDGLLAGRTVAFKWVKGHADEPGNVSADAYASAEADKFERELASRRP